jgi:hypothetical protein
MPTYSNRPQLFVKVKQRDDLYRTFAFGAAHATQAYMKELRAQRRDQAL